MVVHFLKEDALAALKMNVPGNIKNYSLLSNEWIGEFFDGDNPFLPFKTEIEDFRFSDVTNNVENVIRLYSAMKNITDTQASDERLWAGLTHCDFWEFMHDRWSNAAQKGNMQDSIRSRYFFNKGLRRSLFVNTLSKLWWIGRLTYDEKRKDPFELTRYFEDDFSTKALILFSSNYSGNQNILGGLLEALIELNQTGFVFSKGKRALYYEASRYLNVLGGTHILDFYSADVIKERVIRHLWRLEGKERLFSF